MHQQECIACTDLLLPYSTVRVPCDHLYCSNCVTTLFDEAINDEARFPPKCCAKPIPLDLIKYYLNPYKILLYERKTVEYATQNRTYCSREGCNAFVDPASIKEEVASCNKCYQRTCTTCKHKFHDGDCPKDSTDELLVKTAAEKGWQRCSSCRHFVERRSGCNHMTCRCKHQFCYVCGAKWKTCDCSMSSIQPRARPRERRPPRVRRSTFNCNLCPRTFTRAYNLRAHLPTHNEERPFVCSVCNQRFARREDHQRHEDFHASERTRVTAIVPTQVGSWSNSSLLLPVDPVDPVDGLRSTPIQTNPQSNSLQRPINPFEFHFSSLSAAQFSSPESNTGTTSDISSFTPPTLTCLHTSLPSPDWPLYTCTLCSGIVFMCNQCQNWACAACGFATETPPLEPNIDLGFRNIYDNYMIEHGGGVVFNQ